jgi:hypothetical protein
MQVIQPPSGFLLESECYLHSEAQFDWLRIRTPAVRLDRGWGEVRWGQPPTLPPSMMGMASVS